MRVTIVLLSIFFMQLNALNALECKQSIQPLQSNLTESVSELNISYNRDRKTTSLAITKDGKETAIPLVDDGIKNMKILSQVEGVSWHKIIGTKGPKGRCGPSRVEDYKITECIQDDNGQTIAYVERRYSDPNTAKEIVVLRGKEGKPYDSATSLTFSDDGKRWAYKALLGNKLFPVIDGKESPVQQEVDLDCCGEGGHWFEIFSFEQFTFSPDGKHVAFVQTVPEHAVVLDNDVILDASKMYFVSGLQFSPDGSLLTFVAKPQWDSSDRLVMVDRTEGPRLQIISDVIFLDNRAVRYYGYSAQQKNIQEITVRCQ